MLGKLVLRKLLSKLQKGSLMSLTASHFIHQLLTSITYQYIELRWLVWAVDQEPVAIVVEDELNAVPMTCHCRPEQLRKYLSDGCLIDEIIPTCQRCSKARLRCSGPRGTAIIQYYDPRSRNKEFPPESEEIVARETGEEPLMLAARQANKFRFQNVGSGYIYIDVIGEMTHEFKLY